MANRTDELTRLLEPTIEALGFELADLEFHAGRRGGLLRIYIDSEKGVTVDDCETVSHQVSSLLDVNDPISGAYQLEVSSPGMDRRLRKPGHFARLRKPGHFARFMGAQIDVRLNRLVDGRRRIRGRLDGHGNDHLVMFDGDASRQIAWTDVDTVRLVPDFAPGPRKQA